MDSLKDEILRKKINVTGNFTSIENDLPKRLSSDEIKDLICKMTESDGTNTYSNLIDNRSESEAENIGIDLYKVEIFYVLRKSK